MTRIPRAACEYSIDYNTVTGGNYIMPYIISLDVAASDLYPEAGQPQRFCYQIAANGTTSTRYAGMERFVLAISPEITQNDISALAVTINGVPQTVVWGGNAQLVTSQSPDPLTGCAGLRLVFDLNTTNDVMTVCLTLNRAFDIGPARVCLYGEGQVVSSLYICGPALASEEDCPATAYQTVDVCVPVTVTPFATAGDAAVICCGAPTVTPGVTACGGTVGGTCSFTISQRVCMAVPVRFGASAEVGAFAVTCVDAAADACADCAATAPAPVAAPASGCACQARRGANAAAPSAAQTSLNDLLGTGGTRRVVR